MAVAHIASKRKIRKIIVHSHATGNNDFKHGIIKKIADKQFEKKADIFLACSKEAGLFKFPKKIINSNKFKIIKNNNVKYQRIIGLEFSDLNTI